MHMGTKEMERWEKRREKGQKHFIWLYGVLGWGVSTGVVWSIIMPLWSDEGSFWSYLLPAIVIFPIGGYFWGYFMWKWMEIKYHQAKAQKNPE